MLFRIGLEKYVENRSQAWVLGHPGCFAYGADDEAALAAVKVAIRDYAAWIAAHTSVSWLSLEEFEVRVEETWQIYVINEEFELAQDGYAVEAWFRHDWKPLNAEDVERSLKLLSWSRADLLETVHGLSDDILNREYPGERWNITGILKHVGGAEWWYLDRLGLAFPRDEVPQEPSERLDKVRARLVDILPSLVGSQQVVGMDGEFWSPRKLLRRAVWHELDHVGHIRKLL